ncbi:PP2C family protein-serine/threonine phosphatase [Ilumatobacter nonamiensis]|uniref:PP2C family protein-serine/threonine phosphatase n=1 Tax=Ilumatobacter nonamiensis TaxID=467093 RepID=UPI00034B9AD1|nr:PP2C family protein-serine/threonine phosphatase [Ilumatobacter nonamiensis]
MLSDPDHDLQADNDRLRSALRRERRARRHRLEINKLAAVTSGEVTLRGVAEVFASGASDIFSAGWVMVGYPVEDDKVQLIHGPAVPAPIQQDWDVVSIDVEVPMCDVLRGDLERCDLTSVDDFSPWPIMVAESDRAEMASLVVEPIPGDVLPAAVIGLGWDHPHTMDDDDRELLHELATVAAPAFRRANATESDHRVASTLQSWLLPRDLPQVDGLTVSTIYEPGKDELEVGGDWYDVAIIDERCTAIVVGDVVGHDVRAAAEMGQIRHVLSSNLARSGDAAESLALTDHYFHGRSSDTMATALAMVYDASTRTLEIASAGHLPPIVVEPGTAARTLDCGLGPPIGSGLGGYTSLVRPFPARAVIIGFTDGMIERRDAPIDQCIAEFCVMVDQVLATNTVDHAVRALTALVRARAAQTVESDDAAAVILQSH